MNLVQIHSYRSGRITIAVEIEESDWNEQAVWNKRKIGTIQIAPSPKDGRHGCFLTHNIGWRPRTNDNFPFGRPYVDKEKDAWNGGV